MANTFKVITKAGVTSLDVIYTAASSTTTVVLGLVLGNTTGSQVTSTVTLNSDTAARAGANDEANDAVVGGGAADCTDGVAQQHLLRALVVQPSQKLLTWAGRLLHEHR